MHSVVGLLGISACDFATSQNDLIRSAHSDGTGIVLTFYITKGKHEQIDVILVISNIRLHIDI